MHRVWLCVDGKRISLATDATAAERRIIMSIKYLVYCRLEDVKEK